MLLFLFVFSAALLSAALEGEPLDHRKPIWLDASLEEHQEAWKDGNVLAKTLNINRSSVYYLLKSTHTSGTKYRECKGYRVTNINNTKLTVKMEQLYSSYDPDYEGAKSEVAVATLTRSSGYARHNGFKLWSAPDEKVYNVTVIFTDGRRCSLFSVQSPDNWTGCQLWVEAQFVYKVPKCCLFMYKMLCGKTDTYDFCDAGTREKVKQRAASDYETENLYPAALDWN